MILGNCKEELKKFNDNFFDSIVTDPPYELGFMGKKWDSSGISYDVELWKECLRVLKPGGHLLSFSGTRTYHRMAIAIEDAGFEIRDCIDWVYGSGFPKGKNLGNGWNTSLKPAHEPICMARKPIAEKTIAKNVETWGTGGINIEECRISMASGDQKGEYGAHAPEYLNVEITRNVYGSGSKRTDRDQTVGRFPTNLIWSHSPNCKQVVESWDCAPDCPSWEFAKAGDRKSGGAGTIRKNPRKNTVYGTISSMTMIPREPSSGSSDRYFKSCQFTEEDMPCFIYQAKAPKSERGEGNTHPTVKPIKLIQYLCRMVTPVGGIVLDPFGGSGTTALAAIREGFDYVLIELNPEYVEIVKTRVEVVQTDGIPDTNNYKY